MENSIINLPFSVPSRHFRSTDEGITDEIVDGRRVSAYFVLIARPKKKGSKQRDLFKTEWTQDRIEENKFVNRIRGRVAWWRQSSYPDGTMTRVTVRLLDYWTNRSREKKLFFCHIEALETAIYFTESAKHLNGA